MKRFVTFNVIIALMCAITSCKPDPRQQLEERMQTLAATAELGTVEYTVKKIVKTNDKQWFTIGERRIMFQTTAYLKAGVKLDGFNADKVVVDGNKNVTVTLPHATLLSLNMPAEEITTVLEDYGFLRSRFSADDQNHILTLGENDIRESIATLGILDDAEKNATEIFTAMLQQLGYESINIKFE